MRGFEPMIRITKLDRNSQYADKIEFFPVQGADGFLNKCYQALNVLIQSNCDNTIIVGA